MAGEEKEKVPVTVLGRLYEKRLLILGMEQVSS